MPVRVYEHEVGTTRPYCDRCAAQQPMAPHDVWRFAITSLHLQIWTYDVLGYTLHHEVGGSHEDAVRITEAVLRRMHEEGWAEFVRGIPKLEGCILSDEQIEAFIAGDERRTGRPHPPSEPPASNVYLTPTDLWHTEWAAIFRGDIAR